MSSDNITTIEESALTPITDNAVSGAIFNDVNAVFASNILAEYYSGSMTTDEGREAYYKCITECDARVSEMINRVIMVKDIYSARVNARDTETGEIKVLTRVVLIDTDGCTYTCSSAGVANSLSAIFRMFGMPTWENGLPLTVKQKTLKNGATILTLAYTPNAR